jgi:sorting and assembly machinery component 37
VSSKNFYAVTRSAYSGVIPFPLPYFVTPSLRTAAKNRTNHLGLSSLDIDSTAEEEKKSATVSQAQVPASLLTRGKDTVSSLLSQPERKSLIRLTALTRDFMQPLQDLLGDKKLLLSTQPTSLDCLALGYLALAIYPELPSSWLLTETRKNFPKLCTFVGYMQGRCFGAMNVTLEEAFLKDSEGQEKSDFTHSTLPFRAPEGLNYSLLPDHLIGSTSSLSPFRRTLVTPVSHVPRHEGGAEINNDATTSNKSLRVAVAVAAGVGSLLAYGFYAGLATMPGTKEEKDEAENKLGEYGELGNILGAYVDDARSGGLML